MRALGSMETALNLTDRFSPLNLVTVARVSDGPSPAALRQALETLQTRRPELRVRLGREARGGRTIFELAGPAPIPLQTVTPRDDDEWQAAVEAELNTRLPSATGPLARCTYLHRPQPGAPSDIVLTLSHIVFDGGAALGLWRELLALAAGLQPERIASNTLAPPTDQLFPARFQGWRRNGILARFMGAQMAGELRYQIRSRGERRPPIHPTARNRLLARRLLAPVTGALVRRCRVERVGLHSTLSAAALLAVQRHLYAAGAMTLRGITFSDLRPYLQPPVSADAPGCHIALLRYSAELSAGQPFWTLARGIQQQLDQMARRDERFAAQLLAPMLVDGTQRLQQVRLAHTAFNYIGAPELPRAFGATRVLELHAFVSNHRLGPEYTATIHLAGNELVFDIVYLDVDLERGRAEALASEIESLLDGAGRL